VQRKGGDHLTIGRGRFAGQQALRSHAETYMDCPYYEQLQFIMDTRLQMLFTYAVSRDARLAKKALVRAIASAQRQIACMFHIFP